MFVLCVGMYRACSTWQYGVVGAILEKHRAGQRLGFVEGTRFPEKLAENPQTSEWAVLKAHDFHDVFDHLLATGQALGIYSYRDLRDAVASYGHKTGTDLGALRERGFIDLCLNNDRAWRNQPRMLVQNYRDLTTNPVSGIEEIAEHLGVTLEPGEAATIAESLSVRATRRKVESLSAQLRDQGVDLQAEDQTKFDPVSLFHWNHIRPGVPAATWTESDLRDRAIVEEIARPWLVEHGFPIPDKADGTTDEPVAAPVARTSYAPYAVDLRLNRLMRGVKGTVCECDAAEPVVGNASYFWFLRDWRCLNLATIPADRAEFGALRPGDAYASCPLGDGPEATAEALNTIVALTRVQTPDVLILHPATDADRLIDAVVTAVWRPRVVVVDPGDRPIAGANWLAQLLKLGYAIVPGLAGPQILLRADLAGAVPMLARPLTAADEHCMAEPIDFDPAGPASDSDPERIWIDLPGAPGRRPGSNRPAPPSDATPRPKLMTARRRPSVRHSR